jgi:hypothetical protein
MNSEAKSWIWLVVGLVLLGGFYWLQDVLKQNFPGLSSGACAFIALAVFLGVLFLIIWLYTQRFGKRLDSRITELHTKASALVEAVQDPDTTQRCIESAINTLSIPDLRDAGSQELACIAVFHPEIPAESRAAIAARAPDRERLFEMMDHGEGVQQRAAILGAYLEAQSI